MDAAEALPEQPRPYQSLPASPCSRHHPQDELSEDGASDNEDEAVDPAFQVSKVALHGGETLFHGRAKGGSRDSSGHVAVWARLGPKAGDGAFEFGWH